MHIVIDQERLEKLVTVGELLDMQSGNLPVIVSIMSKFVIDETGKYLTQKAGEKKIRALTIAELKVTAADFSKKVTETSVPPTNASDSDELSSQEQQQPLPG